MQAWRRTGSFGPAADCIVSRALHGEAGSSASSGLQKVSPASPYARRALNLGKLWIGAVSGNTASSRLLDGLWPATTYGGIRRHTLKEAMTSVAYHHREGTPVPNNTSPKAEFPRPPPGPSSMPPTTSDHLQGPAGCLWELGKSDEKLNFHPSHAVRILRELCAVEPNKPVEITAPRSDSDCRCWICPTRGAAHTTRTIS